MTLDRRTGRRRCITEVGVIEHASAHLIGNDNSPSDGLLKRAGAGDGCLDGFPVDSVLGGATVPESPLMRSWPPRAPRTGARGRTTRCQRSQWRKLIPRGVPLQAGSKSPDVIVDGQSSDARASVVRIVRVCKALFTIFGACGATRTASVRSDVISFSRFRARPRTDRFRSSLVRWWEPTWHSERPVP